MDIQKPAGETRQRLDAGGLRVTSQRLSVLNILGETEEHLDADAIYTLARDRGLKLSLATVYRTLNVLKEMDLIEQRYFARDHKREYYEQADQTEHYHFTCVSCGRVVEVRTPRIRQAKEELGRELGLVLTHTCVCLEGYCADCAAGRPCSTQSNEPSTR